MFVGGVFKGAGAEYVGNRLRLTAVAPSQWNLPVELGVSQMSGITHVHWIRSTTMYD
jgi:hypothetical protein